MQSVINRNHIKISGNGEKTIIFAHGFGCDQNMWRFIAPHFEKDYRVILFDHVGSGQSDWAAYSDEKYGSLHGYADDLLEICEELNLENTIFIGHSVSSMIGMLASIIKPDYFEKIIMIGPSPCYINHLPEYHGGFEISDIKELLTMMEMNFVGWASHFAPIAMNNPNLPIYSQELEKSFNATDPGITHRFAEATFYSDHREDLSKVTVPCLVIQCSEDSIVPIEVGEYLHRNLGNSTLQIMEAKGHYPHLSHPELTIQYIKEYL